MSFSSSPSSDAKRLKSESELAMMNHVEDDLIESPEPEQPLTLNDDDAFSRMQAICFFLIFEHLPTYKDKMTMRQVSQRCRSLVGHRSAWTHMQTLTITADISKRRRTKLCGPCVGGEYDHCAVTINQAQSRIQYNGLSFHLHFLWPRLKTLKVLDLFGARDCASSIIRVAHNRDFNPQCPNVLKLVTGSESSFLLATGTLSQDLYSLVVKGNWQVQGTWSENRIFNEVNGMSKLREFALFKSDFHESSSRAFALQSLWGPKKSIHALCAAHAFTRLDFHNNGLTFPELCKLINNIPGNILQSISTFVKDPVGIPHDVFFSKIRPAAAKNLRHIQFTLSSSHVREWLEPLLSTFPNLTHYSLMLMTRSLDEDEPPPFDELAVVDVAKQLLDQLVMDTRMLTIYFTKFFGGSFIRRDRVAELMFGKSVECQWHVDVQEKRQAIVLTSMINEGAKLCMMHKALVY